MGDHVCASGLSWLVISLLFVLSSYSLDLGGLLSGHSIVLLVAESLGPSVVHTSLVTHIRAGKGISARRAPWFVTESASVNSKVRLFAVPWNPENFRRHRKSKRLPVPWKRPSRSLPNHSPLPRWNRGRVSEGIGYETGREKVICW